MKYGPKDVQQIPTDGSRIVSVHPGPMVVRVHEARDVPFCLLTDRYYLSVDLRFTATDALRERFWFGRSKSEATKWANELSARIARIFIAIEATKAGNLRGKDILLVRHAARLAQLVSKYEATVEPA